MKRWPLKESYFWERAPFFRLLLPLVVGIVSYRYTLLTEYVTIISSSLAVLICGYGLSFLARQTGVIKALQFLLIQLALIIVGWLSFYQTDIKNHPLWLGNGIDKGLQYEVRITSKAEEKNRTWKYNIAVLATTYNGRQHKVKGDAYLYVYKYSAPAYQEGDKLLLPNRWQLIKNAGNLYEFDYAQFCADKNIHYQQFLSGKDIKLLEYANENSINWIRTMHNWCIEQLERYVTSRETLGLLEAVLAGEKSSLDTTTKQNYANTGIVHVIAISGAHISIFFFLVLFLLSGIKHRKYHWVKYLAALPLIWLYVLVAGAPASAVRAAFMFSILGIGFAFQKQQNGINQLLVAAFALLLLQPAWLFAIGFQLSFLAVLSLFIFYQPIYAAIALHNKPLRTIWSVVAASLAAEVLIAPLVIYYFHLFPIQFIMANILAYFFMSAILVLGMTIVAFSGVPPFAAILAQLTTLLVTLFNRAIEWLAPLNFESFQYLQIELLELLLIYTAIAGLALFSFKKKKPALVVGASAMVLLIAALVYKNNTALQQDKLVVYNINNTGYIERIIGKEHYVLHSSKELSEQTEYYVLRPAHTQWQAWRPYTCKYEKTHLSINNRNVLIVNSKKDTLPDTIIDLLIINYNIKEPQLQDLIKRYQPSKVVLSSILSRLKAANWAEKRAQVNTPIHIVGIDGAFILSGN